MLNIIADIHALPRFQAVQAQFAIHLFIIPI